MCLKCALVHSAILEYQLIDREAHCMHCIMLIRGACSVYLGVHSVCSRRELSRQWIGPEPEEIICKEVGAQPSINHYT